MSNDNSPGHHEMIPNFVKKLVSILADKPNSTAVKWMTDGNGFKILNEQKFTTHVLPKYYRHANMPSFVRQLNMYGFHKIKDGEETFYKHPFFKKDTPDLYFSISRKPQKKNSPLDSQKNSEKQNFSESGKDQKNKKKKKVTFSCENPQKSDSQLNQTFKKTRKELLSNVSLKYERNNPRQSTLLDLNENPQSQPWLEKNYDEGLSICDHLEETDQKIQQFFKSSKKLILWTPSEILSNLNNE